MPETVVMCEKERLGNWDDQLLFIGDRKHIQHHYEGYTRACDAGHSCVPFEDDTGHDL